MGHLNRCNRRAVCLPRKVSCDKETARVLADRLQQMPAGDIAETLLQCRAMTQAPQLAAAFRQIGQTMTNAFQAIAAALGDMPARQLSGKKQPATSKGRKGK